MEEEVKEEETLSKKEEKKEKKKIKKQEKKERKIEKKEAKKKKKEASKLETKEAWEVKKTKKRIHLKKKGIIIPILLVLFLLIGVSTYFGIRVMQKDTVKSIKKMFSSHVITTKNTNLYNSKRKVIGTINKDIELDLESLKTFTYNNRYLKVKDTSYYVFYKDVKKYKEQEQKEEESTYYLPLGKDIKTNQSVTLLDDKKEVITLKKGVEAPITKIDNDYYYITFLNKNFKVKKNKNIKEIDKKLDIKKADHVSIIDYELIDDGCGEDACLKTASVKAHIEHIKKAGYYFITKEDLIAFLNGYINLKENAVFMTTNNMNDNVTNITNELEVPIEKIEDKDGITLSITNKTARVDDPKNAVNAYLPKKYTLIDHYARMAAGEDVPDNGRENSTNQSVPVLNYHFFYDQTIPGESQACNESICLEREKLKAHLQWLKDNNYKTLTIKEFADWYDGIIEIPDKSVLLTIDDGAHGTGAHNGNVLIPLLEEYQEHATLFLIAGWWDIENYRSDYLDIQSHSYNLHYEATCPDGRGKVACSDYQTVKNDLQQSLDVIGDNTSFCFPFYSSDRESIQAIQELGFRVSFVGGSVNAKRSNNRYLIPRYPIMDDISMNEFINMVS